MTEHNNRLLDIYADYLSSSFSATIATGFSRLLPELSHDAVTRFLSQQPLGDRELWKIVKPQVRAVESPDAVLIIDDTVQEKAYTAESELITWHYDHSLGRTVKGINLLSALYLSGDVSLPVAFELFQKTMLVTVPKSGKDPGALWAAVCPQTKNEMACAMIGASKQKQIPFRYVLADIWFASAKNMNYIKCKAGKGFIFPLKSNAALAKSPAKLPHTQQNHIFASLVAFVKLENYRTVAHLNYFALKAKLYQGALQTAFRELQILKNTHPMLATTD